MRATLAWLLLKTARQHGCAQVQGGPVNVRPAAQYLQGARAMREYECSPRSSGNINLRESVRRQSVEEALHSSKQSNARRASKFLCRLIARRCDLPARASI